MAFLGQHASAPAPAPAPAVVGLHCAAHIARATGSPLHHLHRTVQAILQSLLGRLAPGVVSRVDSVNAHTIASQLLQESGVAFRINGLEAQGRSPTPGT